MYQKLSTPLLTQIVSPDPSVLLLQGPQDTTSESTITGLNHVLPAYIVIGTLFVLVLSAMLYLLIVPDARRPFTSWRCVRKWRGKTGTSVEGSYPLRQRGPGDAYEIEPAMWEGGGRLVGEVR